MSVVYVSNLTINSGEDFSNTFELASADSDSPLDLAGYTVTSQMRKYPGSINYVQFETYIPNPTTLGRIIIGLASEVTSTIKPGRYLYDVVLDRGGVKSRVIEGMILVREGVTKV